MSRAWTHTSIEEQGQWKDVDWDVKVLEQKEDRLWFTTKDSKGNQTFHELLSSSRPTKCPVDESVMRQSSSLS